MIKNVILNLRIDFEALRRQKLVLIEQALNTGDESFKEALSGILGVLDTIQDQAVDENGLNEADVFGESD